MQLLSDAQLGSWQKQVPRTSEHLIMNALEGQALDGHKFPLSILLFPELDFCHAIGHEFLQSFRYPAKATEASAICPCSLENLCCCRNERANHQSEQDNMVLHEPTCLGPMWLSRHKSSIASIFLDLREG